MTDADEQSRLNLRLLQDGYFFDRETWVDGMAKYFVILTNLTAKNAHIVTNEMVAPSGADALAQRSRSIGFFRLTYGEHYSEHCPGDAVGSTRGRRRSAIVIGILLKRVTTMDLGLKEKVVLVTGGSKGIGFACARAFALEGAKVAIVSRDPANLARAYEQLKAEGLHVHRTRADLHEPHSAADIVEEVSTALGPIDVLVNSAGAARRYDPEALDADAFRATMEAKYFPYIYPQQEVLRRMAERAKAGDGGDPGTVVNIIGMGGKVASDIHIAGGAANAALMLATVGLAHYYARFGIRINAINPGATLTERVEEAAKLEAAQQGVETAEALARSEAKVPLGRYAKPEEIADVALFLASRRASYVTGAIVPMDGGSTPLI